MLTIIRIIISIIFIVSGWVKAIDPIGTYLKMGEYASAFNFNISDNALLTFSVILCAIELFIGLMLLFKLWERIVTLLLVAVLGFFTLITSIIAISPSMNISDCGCFGEAFNIPVWVTIVKNVVLLAFSLLLTSRVWSQFRSSNSSHYYSHSFMSRIRKRQLKLLRLAVYLYLIFVSFAIPVYSILYLPPYTYMPYEVGADLSTISQNEKSETILLYRELTTGEVFEFNIDDTEWQDETKWEYVDTKTYINGKDIEIENQLIFSLYNKDKENITDSIISASGYTFLIISEDIANITTEDSDELASVVDMNNRSLAKVAIITSTNHTGATNHIANQLGGSLANIEIINADNTLIKSLLRDKNGVILLKDGVIIAKWNSRLNRISNIPYQDLQYIKEWEENRITRYTIGIIALALVMLYLVITYHRTKR